MKTAANGGTSGSVSNTWPSESIVATGATTNQRLELRTPPEHPLRRAEERARTQLSPSLMYRLWLAIALSSRLRTLVDALAMYWRSPAAYADHFEFAVARRVLAEVDAAQVTREQRVRSRVLSTGLADLSEPALSFATKYSGAI